VWGYGALQRPRHGETEVRADLGAGNSPACDVRAPRVGYSSRNLAQKKRGDLEALTKAGIRTGRPCREIVGVAKRRVGAELGGGAGKGVLQALGLPEGVRAGPARVVQKPN
jgi:hypothetical protein